MVTAHDVDPTELMVFLPALCRKMGVPCFIIKRKARLGRLVHRKTCTTAAFTRVTLEDKGALDEPVGVIRTSYNG